MAIADTFRQAAAYFNSYTATVQEPVQQWPWVANDDNDNGRPKYGDAPIELSGLVTREPGVLQLESGDVIEYSHHIAFMGPVADVGAAGRKEPIDPRDKLVFSDGSTNPIVHMKSGLRDPSTGRPFAIEVWLGVKR